jgi:hypothetical protein
LNADWLSSRVCCRKVEIFQLEQHLTRRKIREQARACCAANPILPRRKSNQKSAAAAKQQRVSTFTLNGIVLCGNFLHLLV